MSVIWIDIVPLPGQQPAQWVQTWTLSIKALSCHPCLISGWVMAATRGFELGEFTGVREPNSGLQCGF